MNKQLILLLAALAMVASACTKSKELTNKVDPDAYVDKSSLNGKVFSLVVGIEEADSDNDVDATPGMSTDFGLVKARVNETSLEFDMYYDPNGRDSTAKEVISFPITAQFDIKRDTDDYGDQTNKVIEDKTNRWQDRQFMRVDWAHPVSTSSTLLTQLLGTRTSAKEEDQTLLEDPVVDKDGHISFLVESKISVRDSSIFHYPMGVSGGPSYKVQYRTHFLPLKQTDYKPIPYTLKDFSRFGYFFTQQDFDSPEGVFDTNQNLFVNAHNVCEAGRPGSCSTNKIRWVLSKDFPEKYKAIARKTVQEWNKTFKAQLNRTDDVVYLDESVQANISDPSYNILAFYPARTKSGLLGVAQWASNPMTGELIGVRATIYGDGINYEVERVDDLINLLTSDNPLQDTFGTTAMGSPLTYVSPFDAKGTTSLALKNQQFLGLDKAHPQASFSSTPAAIARNVKSTFFSSADQANIQLVKVATAMPQLFAGRESISVTQEDPASRPAFPTTLSGLQIPNLNGMEQMIFPQAKMIEDRKALLRNAEKGIEGTELVEDAAIRYLYSMLAKGATKADLNAKRQQIEDQIAQLTFYTTALHEMGHAFGLRHNFAGSADKAHYPAEYKAVAAKLAAGDPSVVKEDLDPYASSSIMDYTRDFFDQKNGLGDYDKAAIKYVYNRSINKESDPITLAGFKFCTDHEVGESALCQRFDKGANLSEMVQGKIDSYEHNYVFLHYRRNRVSDDNYRGWGSTSGVANYLLGNIFMPVRQVMDEYLYSLLAAQPADGQGYCSLAYIKASIDAGEMQSICTQDDMSKIGVDPTDMSTFYKALFVTDAQGNRSLKMDPSQYKAYGMADLLYSNLLAQTFFERVIGSPEPGAYLVFPSGQAGTPPVLKPIDESQDIKAQATKMIQDMGADPAQAQAYIDQSPNLVTEVTVAGYGRQLQSRTSTNGGWIRNESIGSYADKTAAIIALALPGQAQKYTNDATAMVGNAYFFPQTRTFTSTILNRLITNNPSISVLPVQTKGGKSMIASAPASIDIDTQYMASYWAAAGMTSPTDVSMVDKLRICNSDEAECSKSATGQKTVSFQAANGGGTYTAIQTLAGDSIAFDLVTAAKAVDDQRSFWVKIRDSLGANQTTNIMTLQKADGVRQKLQSEVAADAQLAAYKFDANTGWKEVIDVQWKNMNDLTTQLVNVSAYNGYQAGIAIISAFETLKQQATTELTAMGDSGKCWVQKNHPEALAPAAGAEKSPDEFAAEVAAKGNASVAAVAAGKTGKGKKGAKLDAPTAPAAPAPAACDDSSAQEQKDGPIRLNLMALTSDLTAFETQFLKPIVVVDIQSLEAPDQITQQTNQLANKEALIQQLRALVKQVSP